MPALLSATPGSSIFHPYKSVVRHLFDRKNGFQDKNEQFCDFVLEDFECLLEDELTIEGEGEITVQGEVRFGFRISTGG